MTLRAHDELRKLSFDIGFQKHPKGSVLISFGDTRVLCSASVQPGAPRWKEAQDLPEFKHPLRAVYILGRERGPISQDVLDRAHHVIRIPTKFCINVATAGAVVMYDRYRALASLERHRTLPK